MSIHTTRQLLFIAMQTFYQGSVSLRIACVQSPPPLKKSIFLRGEERLYTSCIQDDLDLIKGEHEFYEYCAVEYETREGNECDTWLVCSIACANRQTKLHVCLSCEREKKNKVFVVCRLSLIRQSE